MAPRPEVAAFLDGPGRALAFPDPPPEIGTAECAELLTRLRAPRPALPPTRSLWQVRDKAIEGPGGALTLRIYASGPPGGVGAAPGHGGGRPLLVYLHGGGWVMGDLAMHDATCRALAALADCVVLSVDYRLAPEHPHPAALDDTLAALAWARANAAALGVDATRIAVGGSSAGGNLAAAVALRMRDEAARAPARATAAPAPPPLAAQLLLYPVLDSRMATASITEFGAGHLLDRAQLAFYWDAYAPLATVDRTAPQLSPAHAATLAGLPPAVVLSAEHDPLRDEAEQYAARLRGDGVRVELRRARGQIHGFLALFQGDPEVERLLARVAADLVRLLG
ncbi:alpha/beta hydrolase [Conexibacter stalactiti]|uniref:Alpha/beta hydrolase n=1 Tax=Conexibacter stalactiti TaxID=1940611 RepID=A0ABU4HHK7_9ACTN|nr:alpha/beta hydrolase [Conexibacter stalactiti]MDW5592787.1 alpha/beta hydrolase [Conexibacter stalactiti]MEC5033428.1 alpha/beta hydrolase [Conexibacter stalactiti]